MNSRAVDAEEDSIRDTRPRGIAGTTIKALLFQNKSSHILLIVHSIFQLYMYKQQFTAVRQQSSVQYTSQAFGDASCKVRQRHTLTAGQ